jgi:mannose-6-phosphate isomerase-like protein (cupin superfamily)
MLTPWHVIALPSAYDTLAPDGSHIRLLPSLAGASMVHCRLPAGSVTRAVRHKTVEELWYVLAGEGHMWLRSLGSDAEQIVELRPGVGLSLPLGVAFQFRATGPEALDVLIVTTPPWPGPDEAIAATGAWAPTVP